MFRATLKNLIHKLIKRLKRIYAVAELDALRNNPNVSATEHLNIEEYFTANLPSGKFSLRFGPYVHIKKYCHVLIFTGGELSIGENVFINNYCSINCLENVSIGANTMFGEGVKIYDHNHAHSYVDGKLTVERAVFNTAPVSIGANCWIGSNVTILKGVTIGNNAIIGAGNLIYRSVPANTIIKANVLYTTEDLS